MLCHWFQFLSVFFSTLYPPTTSHCCVDVAYNYCILQQQATVVLILLTIACITFVWEYCTVYMTNARYITYGIWWMSCDSHMPLMSTSVYYVDRHHVSVTWLVCCTVSPFYRIVPCDGHMTNIYIDLIRMTSQKRVFRDGNLVFRENVLEFRIITWGRGKIYCSIVKDNFWDAITDVLQFCGYLRVSCDVQ